MHLILLWLFMWFETKTKDLYTRLHISGTKILETNQCQLQYGKKRFTIRDVWATGIVDLKEWDESFLKHHTIVAVENNEIVGFGDIYDFGYLDSLFIKTTKVKELHPQFVMYWNTL